MSNTGKKIIYITPDFPVGGAERFLLMLSNHLADYTAAQHIVSLGSNTALQKELHPSISFHQYARTSRTDFKPFKKLRRLLKSEKPDVVVCLNFFAYLSLRIAMLMSGFKTRTVISYHSSIHLDPREHRMHKLYAKLLRKNDRVICVSEKQAAYTISTYRMPAAIYRTIHNGIDTKRWILPTEDFNKLEWRAKWNIPADANVIISVAALRHEKNHIGAVKALHLLHQEYNVPAYLLLAGDGNMKAAIAAEVEKYGLNSYVIFAGNQSDVRPFCWMSDLFTLCSTSETFSLAALEAMACGLPAVLADIGGASEMVDTGFTGLLCDTSSESFAKTWNEALQTNWNNKEISDQTHRLFSIDKMFEKYRAELLS